jgi:transaldolase / glucose-6-phosphate isomerase
MPSSASNAIKQANTLGQSIWLDSISRDMIKSGELARLVETGVSGVTSNPSIFEKAVSSGASYDEALLKYAESGGEVRRIFEGLAVEDIRDAAVVLDPVYKQSKGKDGFVSIEVSPKLARDTAGTIEEARRLYKSIGRPNVMIKVPGTPEGIPAVRALIGEGINVNVTLLFSIKAYMESARAYMAGLRDYTAAGKGSPSHIASVASFFVSRVDAAADKLLDNPPRQAPGVDPAKLKSQVGIANAKLAYSEFQRMFSGAGFGDLRRAGAQVQRPLWASTSTKDPKLPDTMYVDNLIGQDTVNTLPPATLTAFLEHGNVSESLVRGVEVARAYVQQLGELGISLDAITDGLLVAGVKAFDDSYDKLLKEIETKLARLSDALEAPAGSATGLGKHGVAVRAEIARLKKKDIAQRIWARDESLWVEPSAGGARAKDRLGWLDLPETMTERGAEATAFADEVNRAGLRSAVVLGMGGSSLATETVRSVFASAGQPRPVRILDSPVWRGDDPRARADLFIVSSKSGTTSEPLALERYFRSHGATGKTVDSGASRFVAITDPDTPLAKRSPEFRRVFLAPPDVGGRFSALTEFGLVSYALMGLDISMLAARAKTMSQACRSSGAENPGLLLGTTLGVLAKKGRDKVTIITSPGFERFGLWVEQLLAESTGKDGKGLVPVTGEQLPDDLDAGKYGDDRVFVILTGPLQEKAATRWEQTRATLKKSLEAYGHPVVRLEVPEPYAIAGEFFRWEFAVAVAGHILGVYPFDEPDVASAKQKTTETLQRGWAGAVPHGSLSEAVERLLLQRKPGDYLAVAAYMPEPDAPEPALALLRSAISLRTGMATMFGYGPRYLHSTGQLHKGGPDKALVLVLIQKDGHSPADGKELQRLFMAQASGDVEALRARGKRVEFVSAGRELGSEISALVNSWKI